MHENVPVCETFGISQRDLNMQHQLSSPSMRGLGVQVNVSEFGKTHGIELGSNPPEP